MKKSITELEYLKYKPTLDILVNKFTKKYSIEKDELFSISNLIYCRAFQKQKDNLKDFHKILNKSMTNSFISQLIHNKIRQETIVKKLERKRLRRYYTINNLRLFLSEEANIIIDIIEKAPDEIFSNKNKITKQTLTKYLRNYGWDWKIIRITFDEIALALREVQNEAVAF